MKITAIGLIAHSIFWGARNYIRMLEFRFEWLKEWEMIFRAWREWISYYSYSVDELIYKTTDEDRLKCFSVCESIRGKNLNEIISDVLKEQLILDKDKQIVVDVLSKIGESMLNTEIDGLAQAISKLSDAVENCGSILQERKVLVYKLTPLLCGVLFVLLW